MEFVILAKLSFDLYAPTVAFFLSHLIEIEQVRHSFPTSFARRLVECCLADYDISQSVLPAQLAHAIFTAILDNAHEWPMDCDSEELLNDYVKRVTIVLQANARQFWPH